MLMLICIVYVFYDICITHKHQHILPYKSCLYVTCMTYMAMYGAMYGHICDAYMENICHMWRTCDHVCTAYMKNMSYMADIYSYKINR